MVQTKFGALTLLLGPLLLGSLILAGCTTPAPYDPAQVSVATAQQSASTDVCFARAKANEFPKVRGFTDCIVSAKAQFITAIKLRDPANFNAFSQRMNLIGDQADAGTITLDQASDQMTRVESDFDRQFGAGQLAATPPPFRSSLH
jgi:hypothetical protein